MVDYYRLNFTGSQIDNKLSLIDHIVKDLSTTTQVSVILDRQISEIKNDLETKADNLRSVDDLQLRSGNRVLSTVGYVDSNEIERMVRG